MKLIVTLLFLLLASCSFETLPCVGDPLPNCPKCGSPMNSRGSLDYNNIGYLFANCPNCWYNVRVLPLDHPKCKCEKE